MTDNVVINSVTWATDEVAGEHYQKTKLFSGTADSTTPIAYDASRGLIVQTGLLTRIAQTPTITAGAYAIKDAVGGKLTFANAARVSGYGGHIVGATLVDIDAEGAGLDLVLYNADITPTADNAAFDPTDTDLAKVVGVLQFRNYSIFADNAVSQIMGLRMPFVLSGTTSLFGQLLTIDAPTYGTTADLTVILHILQE